jgi:hypothetical protein
VATYPFVGGPCDGKRSINFTVRPFVGFHWDCGTHSYVFRADGKFHDEGLAAVFQSEHRIHPRQVTRAWSRLMHEYGVTTPRHLARVSAAGKRMRRAVR